jgi:hypothetical protein
MRTAEVRSGRRRSSSAKVTQSIAAMSTSPRATSDQEVAALRRALARVADDPALAQVRASLLLDGFDVLPENAYAAVLALEESAARLGYRELA